MRKIYISGMVLIIFLTILLCSCQKDKTNNDSNTENPGGGYLFTDHVIPDAVTDIDGNQYDAVQLGNQIWMAENLRTTRYADGTFIPLGTNTSTNTPYRYNPNGDEGNVPVYGYLYNLPALMNGAAPSSSNPSGVQGICPTGWHVPSMAEWYQLTTYVSSQSQYVCGSFADYNAKALASTIGWNSSTDPCAVGNDPSTNNVTGFSALPAGEFKNDYHGFGKYAKFWCATETNHGEACSGYLNYDYPDAPGLAGSKTKCCSVRCVRD